MEISPTEKHETKNPEKTNEPVREKIKITRKIAVIGFFFSLFFLIFSLILGIREKDPSMIFLSTFLVILLIFFLGSLIKMKKKGVKFIEV